MSETNGGKVFAVKNWHVILTLVLWAVTVVTGWATVRAQTEQNTRDIERMKQETVSKERFEEYQQDIQRRLQRIEDKLDRDRALRSLH